MKVCLKDILLTADEVKNCTRVTGNVLKLITGNVTVEEANEGKMTYKDMFRDKLRDVVDGKSAFIFKDPPRASSATNIAFYVQCDHQKNTKHSMSVFFEKASLLIGNPLKLTLKLNCNLCQGIERLANNSAANNVHHEDNVNHETSHSESDGFREAFLSIRQNFNNMLNVLENECRSSSNPISYLKENVAKFGLEANITLVNSVAAIQVIDGVSQPVIDSALPPAIAPVVRQQLSSLSSHVSQSSSEHQIEPIEEISNSSTSSFTEITTTPSMPGEDLVVDNFSTPKSMAIATSTRVQRLSFSHVSMTPSPKIATTIESAEKAANQAAIDSNFTPKSSTGKRSARAVLSQKFQDENLAKKSREV